MFSYVIFCILHLPHNLDLRVCSASEICSIYVRRERHRQYLQDVLHISLDDFLNVNIVFFKRNIIRNNSVTNTWPTMKRIK